MAYHNLLIPETDGAKKVDGHSFQRDSNPWEYLWILKKIWLYRAFLKTGSVNVCIPPNPTWRHKRNSISKAAVDTNSKKKKFYCPK